jgi:hypothetical protein
MSLDISLETEARLAAKAREQGLSIDALLDRLLTDAGDLATDTRKRDAPVLPARYLGVRGSLHRRDIYDDED